MACVSAFTPFPRSKSSLLDDFAKQRRLKVKRDECGEPVIPGRFGHLYLFDDGVLGVLVMTDPPRRHYWGHVRSAMERSGFVVVLDGDCEGAATFDPANEEQVKLAIKVAGVKKRRRVSPETAARLARLSKFRRSIAGAALLAAGTRAIADGYIPPHPSPTEPKTGFPTTKLVGMGGD